MRLRYMERRINLRRTVIAYLRAAGVPLPIQHLLTLVVFAEGGEVGMSRDLDNILKGVMSALDDTANCLWRPRPAIACGR